MVALSFGIAYAQTTQTALQNPLNASLSSVPNFIAAFLRIVVTVALPIISLMIVYSGFLFVSAQGNEEKISKAKTNLMYVLIGTGLILGAWTIATLLGGTVTQLTGTSTSFN